MEKTVKRTAEGRSKAGSMNRQRGGREGTATKEKHSEHNQKGNRDGRELFGWRLLTHANRKEGDGRRVKQVQATGYYGMEGQHD